MTHTMKDVLLDQIAACHNDRSWFPPIDSALENLTAEQAAWREDETDHSIWQIVNHLAFWNRTWLSRFKGEPELENLNNEMTFETNTEVTPDSWSSARTDLDHAFAEWRKVLSDYPESSLELPVPRLGEGALWWGAISNLSIHNAYHIGQIVMIRKKQGTWPHK